MTAYRVVQWATGNIGTRALRSVIEHPGLSLAGVYVHSPAKAGKDAGDLCGLPATGVTATGDIGEILALGADCVPYMPAACDVDEVCRLHPPASAPPSTSPRSSPPSPDQPLRPRLSRGLDIPERHLVSLSHGCGSFRVGPGRRARGQAAGRSRAPHPAHRPPPSRPPPQAALTPQEPHPCHIVAVSRDTRTVRTS